MSSLKSSTANVFTHPRFYPFTHLLIVSLFLLTITSAVNAAKIIYVDIDRPDGGGGTSWADANNSLSDALTDAHANRPSEVRVAQGTYKPKPTNPILKRLAAFSLYSGMNVKGGYAGFGETDPNARNIDLYETILSGDMDGDDALVAPSGLLTEPTRNDNCFHVVILSGGDATAILDGFTITGGSSVDASLANGGGIQTSGGGMILNCTIIGNSAGNGGGAELYGGVNVVFIDCDFIGNAAANTGGAVKATFLDLVGSTFINCRFTGNLAGTDGGAYRTTHDSPNFVNCTFSKNQAGGAGGGACFTVNEGTPAFTNSILWGNTAVDNGQQIAIKSGTYTVSINYSDVHGGTSGVSGSTFVWGSGNINSNPLFVDANGPDNTAGTEDDDIHVLSGSPCIDSAKNSAVPVDVNEDLDGNPRFVDDPCKADTGNGTAPIVDMGTYEVRRYIYADADVASGKNGTSWTNAYKYLQDALSAAKGGWGEILVAEGTYKPDKGTGFTAGDRTAMFQLKKGIDLTGGYAGFGESDPNKRNIINYQTILSGDLLGNDVGFTNNAENSYHVVKGADNVIIDGFTITAGDANGGGTNYYGAGLYNASADSTVINCTFTTNWASSGGGIYNNAASAPEIIGCLLYNNTANNGAGMYNISSSTEVTNCTFSDNTANVDGGGIYSYQTCPLINSTILYGNTDSGGSDESAQIYPYFYFGSGQINYSCIKGWTDSLGGTGNIASDPCFVDVSNDDYHIRWSSNCINTGDPSFTFDANERDFDGEPRVMAGRVDMGVDETSEKQTDFTRNGRIDFEDLGVFVQSWLTVPVDIDWYILCDLQEDAQINFKDYTGFAADWLWEASWYEP